MNNFCDILKEIYIKTAETRVEDYEVNRGIKDEQGVIYSRDGKRLLKVTSPETLKEYSIKESTEIICDGAFFGCSELKSLIIPSSVKSIGKHVFEWCCSLKELNIPSSVEWIAPEFLRPSEPEFKFGKFKQFCAVENIHIEGNHYYIKDNLLIDNNLNRLVYCLKSQEKQIVPQGIIVIDQGAFYHNEVRETLSLPQSLKVIRSKAFYMYRPKTLDLPDSVEIIEDEAFRFSEQLSTVKFSKNIKILQKDVFHSCKNLQEITLPEGLEVIDDGCFQSCPLTNIKIPKSIKIMGNKVFSSSHMEERMAEIEFDGVPQLMGNEIVDGYSDNFQIKIPDGSRPSFERSFKRSENIYYNCELEAERDITESDLGKVIKDENGITYSEDGRKVLFISEPYKKQGFHDFDRECPPELIIREGVEIICSDAFRGCQSLNRVILPSTLLAIGPNAFESCENLSEIIFGKQLLSIGSAAFRCCSSLDKVQLPSSLTTIRERAFELCSRLAEINIPNSVSYIGFGGFMGCARALEHIVLPTSLVQISDYTFHECCVLKDVVLPPSIIEIGKNSFGACLQLERICIPDSVESINDKAFFRCLKLSHIDFPSRLDFIGDYAFDQCNSFDSITLPLVKDILCHGVFSYCTNLKNVIIPETIDYVQDDTFKGCDIENFYIQGNKFLWDGQRLVRTQNGAVVYERP